MWSIQEFDWEAAVQAIDVACQATSAGEPTSVYDFNSSFDCNPQTILNPVQEREKKGKFDYSFSSVPSKQSTLDRFIGASSSNSKKSVGKAGISNGISGNRSYGNGIGDKNGGGVAEFEDIGMLDGFVKIDPEAAKTWIYPVNVPRRDYQFSITRTALFSNTLVVLPTGHGKTLIAAVVMYNFFGWFPEGKIVFAAPSRPLVVQQIQSCHKIVGIQQEWPIDLTGLTSPSKRADFWKSKRVFFVTPQLLEKDIHSGNRLEGDMGFISSMTNCTRLEILEVSDNLLSGSLPEYIANLSTILNRLSISQNQLYGTIPSNIGNLIGLSHLNLSYNDLEGPFPSSIGKLHNLQEIYLEANRLTNELPFSLGNLTLLICLYLEGNSFHGNILRSKEGRSW